MQIFKEKMVPQSEYSAGRSVCIWLGNCGDEDELDDYLYDDNGFSKDYGFELDERSLPEVTVEEEQKSIRDLLNGFSLWDQFIEEAVSKSKELSIEFATTVVIFHFLAYPKDKIRNEGKFRYLGRFSTDGFK